MFHDHDGRAVKPEDLFLAGYPIGEFERGILNPHELLIALIRSNVEIDDLSLIALRAALKEESILRRAYQTRFGEDHPGLEEMRDRLSLRLALRGGRRDD